MWNLLLWSSFFFFQAEDGIRDIGVTGVQTCALPIYDAARTVYWAFDRRPALIVRAVDEIDVIAAVDYARETGTPLSVRSGGQSFGGFGVVCGGTVVVISGVKEMRRDPGGRTGRVEAGRNWGECSARGHADVGAERRP